MKDFSYHKPSSVSEAIALLAASGESRPMSGGMTLLPTMKQRLASPSALIDLAALPELSGITIEGGNVTIGAMTHNAWDSFTHPAGFAVVKFPLLRESVWVLGNRNVRVYELLQHSSTLVGLLVILVAYLKWLKRVSVAPVIPRISSDRWRYILLFGLAAASMILATPVAYEMSSAHGRVDGSVLIVRVVICATSIFAVALCSISLLLSRRGSATEING